MSDQERSDAKVYPEAGAPGTGPGGRLPQWWKAMGMGRDILLVEPGYRNKYPPLGLMKIAAYHRDRGDRVHFHKHGFGKLEKRGWDRVYVTTLVQLRVEADGEGDRLEHRSGRRGEEQGVRRRDRGVANARAIPRGSQSGRASGSSKDCSTGAPPSPLRLTDIGRSRGRRGRPQGHRGLPAVLRLADRRGQGGDLPLPLPGRRRLHRIRVTRVRPKVQVLRRAHPRR